jgi:hypothetical protein
MPKQDFGRCDGHHEMDDFHAQKNAPGLGGAFLSKESPEHAGAFQEGNWFSHAGFLLLIQSRERPER